MLTLLRWLDNAGVVSFHLSKTNGDYVLEYSSRQPGREHFRQFVLAFERVIYGGDVCDQKAFERMTSRFQQVQGYARQKS